MNATLFSLLVCSAIFITSCGKEAEEAELNSSESGACTFQPAQITAKLGQKVSVKLKFNSGTGPYRWVSFGIVRYVPDTTGGKSLNKDTVPILPASPEVDKLKSGQAFSLRFSVDSHHPAPTADKQYVAQYPGSLVEDAIFEDSNGKSVYCGPLNVKLVP